MPNQEPSSEPYRSGEKDDVEAHGLGTDKEQTDTPEGKEEADVEAHILGDKVFVDRPNS